MNKVLLEGYVTGKPVKKIAKNDSPYVFFMLTVPAKKIYVGDNDVVPVLPPTTIPIVFFTSYADDFVNQRQKGDLIVLEGKIGVLKKDRLSIIAEKINVRESVVTRNKRILSKKRYELKQKEKEALETLIEFQDEEAIIEAERKSKNICKSL